MKIGGGIILLIDGDSLTLEDLVNVAVGNEFVELSLESE